MTKKKNSPNKLTIAATIFPLYDITKNISGNKANIVQIYPNGASPHTYEPTLKDQEQLVDSTVVFAIGHDLDTLAIEIAKSANKNVEIVLVDKNITLLASNDEDEGGEYDPHYWNSITNAKIIAQNIYDTLIYFDPSNKDFYKDNLDKYLVKLDNTRNSAIEKISQLEQKSIITFHGGFYYFADDLGLSILTTIEPFPGKEPSLQYIQEVGDIIERYNVKVLFKEPQLSDSIVKSLSDDYGVDVKVLDPIGNSDSSFIDNFNNNVDTIVESLSE